MKKIVSSISKICLCTAMIMAVCLFLCVLIEVFFRTMIKLPVIWTEEGARYFFVCMIFIGAVAIFERDQNVRLKIFSSKLSERGKKILYLINCTIMIVFTVLFLLGSIQMAKIDWRIPPVTISWLRKGYLFLVCAISCVFIIIIAIFHFVKRLKENKVY